MNIIFTAYVILGNADYMFTVVKNDFSILKKIMFLEKHLICNVTYYCLSEFIVLNREGVHCVVVTQKDEKFV